MRQEAALQREERKKALRAALNSETLQNPTLRRWATRVLGIIAIVALIGDVALYNRFSPFRPLVTIGHRVVRQREYMADLDGTAGKAVLSRIVYDELIQQAADKANVQPAPRDVDARLADMRRHATRALPPDAAIWDQVRLQLALENLRLRGVTATDAEIAAYYDRHKAQFGTPARAHTTLVVTRSAADAARAAGFMAQGKTEGEIAAQSGMRVAGVNGFRVNLGALPPALRAPIEQAAFTMPLNQIKTFRLAADAYITLQTHSRDTQVIPPLAQVHDQVARLVRLQKAPSERDELVALYHANPPSFDMARYGSYFSDVPPAGAAKPPSGPKTSSLPAAGTP